jgi:hypothetical protein
MEIRDFDIFFVEGHCSFCFNAGKITKSSAAISLEGLKSTCQGCISRAAGDVSIAHSCATEICSGCLKTHCKLHGSKPIVDGFVCHSCSSYRQCRNKQCTNGLFRGCLKERFCVDCVADRILAKAGLDGIQVEPREQLLIDLDDDEEDDSETEETDSEVADE